MLVKHAIPGRVQLKVSHYSFLALILLFEALLRTQGLLGWHMDVEKKVAVETLSVVLLHLEHPYDLVVFDMLRLSFSLLLLRHVRWGCLPRVHFCRVINIAGKVCTR
jgi:hypothetical protein